MTALFPAQRAAEEFDRALAGTAGRAVADRHAALLATVEVLRAQPEVLPRAEFVEDLRARLMVAAEAELVTAPPVPLRLPTPAHRQSERRRRAGTIAAALVIVGGTGGMAAAASGALPGESLYPIKRGGEQVSTAVRIGEASKGRSLLGQAETRLDEVGQLLDSGTATPELLGSTLDSFRTAADDGSSRLFVAYQQDGDAADITTVREFAAAQMATIADLASDADPTTASLLVDAADTLADIDQQARVLCGGCGPETVLAPPGTLGAGAAAASVENLIVRPAAQAQADVEAMRVKEHERLLTLRGVAEHTAGTTPKIDLGTGTTAGATPDAGPVRSTITRSGELVPSVSTGVAVRDLVAEVTGARDGLTADSTANSEGLGSAVDDLTDGVDDGPLP